MDFPDQREEAMLMMHSLPLTAKEGEIDSMLLEGTRASYEVTGASSTTVYTVCTAFLSYYY
jgi:hypothetical protein